MDKPKKGNRTLVLLSVILLLAAGVLLSFSLIVFKETHSRNEELIETGQKREDQLGEYGEWFREHFRMLLNDARFNNLLEIFDLLDKTRDSWQALQQKYPPILNGIGESLNIMMSQILQLFNTQIKTISTIIADDAENLPDYTDRLFETQRIFVDMMSANLKIVSSRFFTNTNLPEELISLSSSMMSSLEALENQALPYLISINEKEIIATLLEASGEWESRLNGLLAADKRKASIIATIVPQINNSLKTTNPDVDEKSLLYSLTRISITWIIPLILITTAFLLIVKNHKSNSRFMQMIKEKETAKEKLEKSLENEKRKNKTLSQTIDSEQKAFKIQLTKEKETSEALRHELNALKASEKAKAGTEKAHGRTGINEKRLKEKLADQDSWIKELERFKTDVKAIQTELETAINDLNHIKVENEHEKQSTDKRLNELLGTLDQTIDENEKIFSQTRLLSLNAAIESARAGEKGKGFGIVADKIRELSEKSQDTSAELKESVNSILTIYNDNLHKTEKAEHGSETIEEIISNLSKINASLKHQTEKIKDQH